MLMIGDQDKLELENWYKYSDPWGYETNPDDLKRKAAILQAIPKGKYRRALDIGCGEGWITKDLPAAEIHGIELSDNAAARLPSNVKRVSEPQGEYDLIICTGMLYKHYDYKQFTDWIKRAAKCIVITCNIKDWETNDLPAAKQVMQSEFPYREFTQKLRVYKW